jgi:phage gpG-like protein
MLFEFNEITLPEIPNKLEGVSFEKFKGDMSAKLFSQRLEVFNAESSRDGPWKPLSQLQQERREAKLGSVTRLRQQQLAGKGFAKVKILQDRGVLRQSFTPESGPGNAFRHVELGEDFVRISTNVEYARIHNKGGVIRPVKAAALVFQAPGGGLIFAKKVTIPARPFDEFTDANEAELAELTEHYLNGRLR